MKLFITKIIRSYPKYLTRVYRFLFPNSSVCLILTYHRVFDLKSDPHEIAVSKENFKKQMTYIKNRYNVITLDQLIDHKKTKSLPKKSIIITFDDGYVDNLINAVPVLEELQIPATIYIATDYIDSNSPFWWDLLGDFLEKKLNQIKPADLEINENIFYKWKSANLSFEIHKHLKYLSTTNRNKLLTSMFKKYNYKAENHTLGRCVTSKELKKLHQNSYITIGAHTQTHPLLRHEIVNNQYKEIFNSKTKLETTLTTTINHFSIPFGEFNDYSINTIKLVKKSGYQTCVTTNKGLVMNSSSNFSLRRAMIRNWDEKEFNQQLEKFFKW